MLFLAQNMGYLVDVFRSGSAASPHNAGTCLNQLPDLGSHLLCGFREHGFSILVDRQSGIGMDQHRNIRVQLADLPDDLNHAGQCLELRYASGSENFTPLGCPDITEHPTSGEIIYVVFDSDEVMCRRWNCRNGHKTRITEETQAIVMNIDTLGEQSEARAVGTRDRVAEMLAEFCRAEIETTLLTPSNRQYQVRI